jgi:Domain of unknown function (DUF222)
MPQAWEEFTPVELAPALGESRGAAEDLLGLALDLAARLLGTAAAFRTGIVNAGKAAIIARATEVLDPAEAATAEALVLGRAGRGHGPASGPGLPGHPARHRLPADRRRRKQH